MNAIKVINYIEILSEWSGKLVSFIILPNVLALVYEVCARYLFKSPTIWSYEVTYMLYAVHFLIGFAYTLKHNRHISIEAVSMHYSIRLKAIFFTGCYLILFIPTMIVLIYGSFGYVIEAIILGLKSTATPWQPILWPFRMILPVSFILLFLQGLGEMVKNLRIAIGGAE